MARRKPYPQFQKKGLLEREYYILLVLVQVFFLKNNLLFNKSDR